MFLHLFSVVIVFCLFHPMPGWSEESEGECFVEEDGCEGVKSIEGREMGVI